MMLTNPVNQSDLINILLRPSGCLYIKVVMFYWRLGYYNYSLCFTRQIGHLRLIAVAMLCRGHRPRQEITMALGGPRNASGHERDGQEREHNKKRRSCARIVGKSAFSNFPEVQEFNMAFLFVRVRASAETSSKICVTVRPMSQVREKRSPLN